MLELLLAAVQTRILWHTDGPRVPTVCVDITTRCFSCHRFTDDGNSVTRLGHNDQALTDPDLKAHLVVCHIARQSSAASTLGFSSHRWSRQCVISLHLKVDSMHRTHGVTRVASLTVAHVDLRQNCYASRSSTRVDSNESFVLCKAILTSSPVQM